MEDQTSIQPELEALLTQNEKHNTHIEELLDILIERTNNNNVAPALDTLVLQNENIKDRLSSTMEECFGNLCSKTEEMTTLMGSKDDIDYTEKIDKVIENTAKIGDLLGFFKEKPEFDDQDILSGINEVNKKLTSLVDIASSDSNEELKKSVSDLYEEVKNVSSAIRSTAFTFDYSSITNVGEKIQRSLNELKVDTSKHSNPENAIAVKVYDSKNKIIDNFSPLVNLNGGGSTGSTSSGGDGAIVDGSDSTIKATVLDYSNSNPLAVRLTDTNGDYVSAGGSQNIPANTVSANETGNSTVVALAGNGVFTGTWEDVSSYQAVSIQTRSDAASAANGLQILFSPNGSDADTPYVVTCSANQEKTIIRPVINKYFKIIYTNGAGAQGFLRLQTIYHGTSVQATMTDMLGDSREVLTPRLLTAADNRIYNGSTGFYDRQRSVVNMTDTSGTGVVSVGLMGKFDDASTTTVTEDNFAPVRISSRRALLVEGVDGGQPIAVNQKSLSGAGSDTTITLTNLNTAYQVPASPPASDYVLVISNQSDTNMTWGFQNTGTLGNLLIATTGLASMRLAANDKIYVRCASSGKVLNYSTKIV